MRKMKIKKIFESRLVDGNLSMLCNIRDAINWQNRERTDNLIDTFRYQFEEIEYCELLKNNDKIYVIQTASNKFLEVDKEDLNKFDI